MAIRDYQVEALKEMQEQMKRQGWHFNAIKPGVVSEPVKRFVVYCWEAVASYAHSKAPEAVCEVLAASPESAQDAVREASCGHYEAFETHSAENNRFQEGLTFEEFRDMHLERVK